MMVCTCKILAGGVVSTWLSQICRGGLLFWSTHIHTQNRLDKSHTALAEARLKTHYLHNCNEIYQGTSNLYNYIGLIFELPVNMIQ